MKRHEKQMQEIADVARWVADRIEWARRPESDNKRFSSEINYVIGFADDLDEDRTVHVVTRKGDGKPRADNYPHNPDIDFRLYIYPISEWKEAMMIVKR